MSPRDGVRVLILVAATVAVPACHRSDAYDRPPPAVRVATVAVADGGGVVRYSGRVEAHTEVDLAFRVGGYVTTIATTPAQEGGQRLLQAGDPIRRGAVLAVVRQDDYTRRYEELRGMRDDARAALAKAKLDLQRSERLLAEGAIAQAEYDAVKARHDSLAGAELAAGARVGAAGIALGDTRLRAPLDGIVLHRAIEPGDLVAPGRVGFTVADTTTIHFVFGVPDSVQKQLALGRRVRIRTDALPERKFEGALTKIAARADERARTFEVEATVANGDQALKVGMIATAELDTSSGEPASAIVPLSAVVPIPERPGAYGVFVATATHDATIAHLVPVVLGSLVRNDVAVLAGVSPGDRVVVVGASMIHDGDRVAVVP